jgi:hypothetical protein
VVMQLTRWIDHQHRCRRCYPGCRVAIAEAQSQPVEPCAVDGTLEFVPVSIVLRNHSSEWNTCHLRRHRRELDSMRAERDIYLPDITFNTIHTLQNM